MKKSCPHCNKKIKYDKPQQFGAHITNCKENPNKEETIKKIKITRHNNLFKNYELMCLNCNKKYNLELTDNQYRNGRYKKCCSSICSHKYSSSFVDYKKTKKSICNNCNDIVYIKNNASHKYTLCSKCREPNIKNYNISKIKESRCNNCNDIVYIKNNTSHKYTLCNKCKPKKTKKCSACGQNKCKSNICKSWIAGRSKIFIKLGFDLLKLGTLDFYNEYNRILNLLIKEYKTNSLVEIGEKYGINYQTIHSIFKSLNIKTRNNKDSGLLSIKKGRKTIPEIPIYPYKSGYHTSWDNNKIYYRSTYELDYCNFLDKNKIKYEVESLRIQYYDTIKKHNRTAIPDFYLLDTNEIVEIKSDWTYDEQNMKDKIIAYKNNGYNIKLILEHKEYIM